MSLSDSKIFNNTEHRAVSLRQLSFLLIMYLLFRCITCITIVCSSKLSGLTCFLTVRSQVVTEAAESLAIRWWVVCVLWMYISYITPASDIASRQRLRSASRHQLLVPRYRLSSLGRRSFAVAGPMTWNSLSADLRDPTCSDESFRHSLKTFLFAKY